METYLEQKCAVRVGTQGRITIPKRMFDAIGKFEKNAYLVISFFEGEKKSYPYPVETRRITTPFFKNELLVISYDPHKGQYFQVVEHYTLPAPVEEAV